MKLFTKKTKEPRSLKKRLLFFMILCWLVPIAIFYAFTTVSYRDGIIDKAEGLMEDELINVASFASIRIEDAISLCQRPSYEKTWENAWKDYNNGETSKTDFLLEVNANLKGKFYLDERFNTYAFYLYGNENPECYSSRAGYSYNNYIAKIQPYIEEVIELDSSYAYVKVYEGRIFIIRNLYTTSDYERYGTLVVELNRDKIFQDVPKSIRENMIICMNTQDGLLNFMKQEEMDDRSAIAEQLLTEYDGTSNRAITRVEDRNYNGYLYQEKADSYHIGVIIFAKRSELYSSLYDLYKIVFIMLLLFLPLMSFGVYFLHREIQTPMNQMFAASKELEEGKMGVVVGGPPMPNKEFHYLKESFDSMSSQVKYLFDTMYSEKLARKDAQIQALQAQINPHFLNNTLEMMNWQARMSGDAVVSKMIESLGTVLDYRMNRANVKEIHLAEELQCTDAYFYIMSMRFGQRLSIEKEIDEDLLYIKVPPLILQPIVENAIVHGVETVKNGTIRLKVYHDDKNVYLQVSNSGKRMTEEAKIKIRAILSGNEEQLPKYQGRHTSIGIQNVNKRIQLVYGEEYGLTIDQDEHLITNSLITLPYQNDEKDEEQEKTTLQKEQNKIEQEPANMARLNK